MKDQETSRDLLKTPEFKRFNHRKNLPNGYQEIHLWLPSCGGVDIGINVTPEKFRRPKTDFLKNIKNAVINARPQKAVAWLAKIAHFPATMEALQK